jgi:hypothetical protein
MIVALTRSLSMRGVALVTVLGIGLLAQDGRAQSSRLPTPYRTYSLELPVNDLWTVVIKVLEEAEFTVLSESRVPLSVVALGKPYDVRKGLRRIQQRAHVTIEVQERVRGIYDCFVTVQIQERWPIPGQWTVPSAGAAEEQQEEVLILLGNRLTRELRSHFRVVGG